MWLRARSILEYVAARRDEFGRGGLGSVIWRMRAIRKLAEGECRTPAFSCLVRHVSSAIMCMSHGVYLLKLSMVMNLSVPYVTQHIGHMHRGPVAINGHSALCSGWVGGWVVVSVESGCVCLGGAGGTGCATSGAGEVQMMKPGACLRCRGAVSAQLRAVRECIVCHVFVLCFDRSLSSSTGSLLLPPCGFVAIRSQSVGPFPHGNCTSVAVAKEGVQYDPRSSAKVLTRCARVTRVVAMMLFLLVAARFVQYPWRWCVSPLQIA